MKTTWWWHVHDTVHTDIRWLFIISYLIIVIIELRYVTHGAYISYTSVSVHLSENDIEIIYFLPVLGAMFDKWDKNKIGAIMVSKLGDCRRYQMHWKDNRNSWKFRLTGHSGMLVLVSELCRRNIDIFTIVNGQDAIKIKIYFSVVIFSHFLMAW